jgi:hypothetical protein
MMNAKLAMTAHTPSRFGMPICGPDFGATTPAAAAAPVVRERVLGTADAVKGAMGLVQSYFPGTSAWRPPTC